MRGLVLGLAGLTLTGGVSLAEANIHSALPNFLASAQPLTAIALESKPPPNIRPIIAMIVSEPDRNANMVICRENQAATGSRLGASRECHTKKEWDERRSGNQRTIENAQQIGLTGNPSGN